VNIGEQSLSYAVDRKRRIKSIPIPMASLSMNFKVNLYGVSKFYIAQVFVSENPSYFLYKVS
jgi:hypothetical protein